MLLQLASFASAAVAAPGVCAPQQISAPSDFSNDVRRARALLGLSITSSGSARSQALAPEVLVMPEFQATLRGPEQVAAYERAMLDRFGPARATTRSTEVLDLGELAVETGEFTIDRGGGRRGKYMAVWERGPQGARLVAEASGYVHSVEGAAADVLFRPENTRATPDKGSFELRALNGRMEQAIKARDAGTRSSYFASDAVFMPFADTPKVGFEAIRQHLVQYNSGNAVVDAVRIWTERQQRAGRYVIEYPRFEARWRAGQHSGQSQGKGIRLWWRAPSGALKLCREIGNHDEPVAAPRSMIRLKEASKPSAPAKLADLSWLAGNWIGRMPGGPVEHQILPSSSGHLPGFVRAVGPDGVLFYEITVFAATEGSLSYRVKHFTPELAGWEPQGTYIDRPLVAKDRDTFYFDGITFARTGPNSFIVYFLPRDGGKEGETLVIPFRRQGADALQ